MKTKKLFGIILAISLIISVFAAFSVANAQECSWTLYVDGEKYSETADYYTSGKLRQQDSMGTVYLDGFTGKTIEAIPGGFYGDDDAPNLVINVSGNCTLTGGTLDDGSYGALYAPKREGGTGNPSRIYITSSNSGTLNLNKVEDSYTQSSNIPTAYNAISADEVVTGGNLNLNINTHLNGVGTSDMSKMVYGINANYLISISNTGITNINMSAKTINIPRPSGMVSEYPSYAKVQGIVANGQDGVVRLGNGSGYLYVDVSDTNSKIPGSKCIDANKNITTGDYRYAIYLNAGKNTISNLAISNTVNLKEFNINDGNTNYAAYIPTIQTNNPILKAISSKDIITSTFYKISETPQNDPCFQSEKTCYIQRIVEKVPNLTSNTTYEVKEFENKCTYRYSYKFVPKPGYHFYAENNLDLDVNAIKTANNLPVTPDRASIIKIENNSKYYVYTLRYIYDGPEITIRPVNRKVKATESAVFNIGATGSNLKYQWYSIQGDTISTLNDNSYQYGTKTNAFVRSASGAKPLCNANGLKYYCDVSNEYGTVRTNTVSLIVEHQINGDYTPDKENHTYKCYCGEIITEAHKETSIPAISATCTTTGLTEGKKCSVCNETIVYQEPIPVTNHHYKVTVRATTTGNGKYTCIDCGKTKTIDKASTPTLSKTTYLYNGKVQKPSVTVKDSKGNTLKKNIDYTVRYNNSNSKKIGTYKVTITFKGKYSGTKNLTYKIVTNQVTNIKTSNVKTKSLVLTWSKVYSAKYYKVEKYYTRKKSWTIVDIVQTNKITISNLKAGTKYQFRVTALDSSKETLGKPSSTLTVYTLTSSPKVTLKSTKSKTATASWEKVSGATKYAIYKSTNGKKWTKVKTITSTSYTIKDLSGGKKIYIKVYGINANSLKSAASTTKSVTVKK